MSQECYISVDLDGTLAMYNGWQGSLHIGEPIPLMVDRVKKWIEEGACVKIFTARVAYDKDGTITKAIQDWCEKHIGKRLQVTCNKDYGCVAYYDDRAVSVEFNTGKIVGRSHYELPEWLFIKNAKTI